MDALDPLAVPVMPKPSIPRKLARIYVFFTSPNNVFSYMKLVESLAQMLMLETQALSM